MPIELIWMNRRTLVDGFLACRSTSGARACGEHRGISAVQVFGHGSDIGRLEITKNRFRTSRPHIGEVVGVAHQRGG
jgi:hypothetical protein